MELLISGKWRNNNAAQQIYEVSKIMVPLITAAKGRSLHLALSDNSYHPTFTNRPAAMIKSVHA